MKRLMVLLAVGLLAGGLLAGCSGSGSDAAPVTVELSSTTSSTAAPTTTSTTEATTTTVDPNIAEIESVYREYTQYFVVHGLEVDESVLDRLAADPLLSRVKESIVAAQSSGSTLGKTEYLSAVVSVLVDGDVAVLVACDLDGIELLSSDGQVLFAADAERSLLRTELVRQPDGWRIVENDAERTDKVPCDPS